MSCHVPFVWTLAQRVLTTLLGKLSEVLKRRLEGGQELTERQIGGRGAMDEVSRA